MAGTRQSSSASGGGGSILNTPYDPNTWLETTDGASRLSIRNKIESMGYLGNVAYVDNTYGNDSTGVLGNILKPFATHAVASAYISSGTKGLIVTFPGTYSITNSFGFPMKNNVDHLIFNADIVQTGFAYGIIMIYPVAVNSVVTGIGTVRFLNQSSNADWATITPYVGCNLHFKNVQFIGAKQIIGQQGLLGGDRFLRFTDCRLEANDNAVSPVTNALNFVDGSALFERCYIKGYWSVSNFQKSATVDYKCKWVDCEFEAVPVNTNGFSSSLGLWDYGADATTILYRWERCKMTAAGHNIDVGEGYAGIGTNKFFIMTDSDFFNGANGWANNQHINLQFKLRRNWSQNNSSGLAVANGLVGPGFTIDPNLS